MKNYTLLFSIALILLLIASSVIGLWIYVCADDSLTTFDEMKQAYLDYFPSWLQNARVITLINIALLGVAGGLFIKLADAGYKRVASLTLAIFTGILFIWNVFSLM